MLNNLINLLTEFMLVMSQVRGGICLLLLFAFSLTKGQTYNPYTVRGGNGTLSETIGLTDSNGYSSIVMQFLPKVSFLIFLDPNQKELARYQVNSVKLEIKGYSSNEKEFIIYFDGRVNNAKEGSYFVAFFKNGNQPPIFSEWLDIPYSHESLFSFSCEDQLFVAMADGNNESLTIYQTRSVNSVKKTTYKINEETLKAIKQHSSTVIDPWGTFTSRTSHVIVPFKDYLQIIYFNKNTDRGDRLEIVKFDLVTGSSIEKFIPLEDTKEPALCSVDNLLFITDNGKKFNSFFRLRIYSLETLKLVNKVKFDPDSVSAKSKLLGPLLNLNTGAEWTQEGVISNSQELLNVLQGSSIVGVSKFTNGIYALRPGVLREVKGVVSSGSGSGSGTGLQQVSNEYPLGFSLFLDRELNVLHTPLQDNYMNLLIDFQKLTKRKYDSPNQKASNSLYFSGNASSVISFYYSDKTNELFVSKTARY